MLAAFGKVDVILQSPLPLFTGGLIVSALYRVFSPDPAMRNRCLSGRHEQSVFPKDKKALDEQDCCVETVTLERAAEAERRHMPRTNSTTQRE